MKCIPLPILNEDRLLHSWNAPMSIVVTLSGIEIDVNPLQPAKAHSLMALMLFGISTEIKPEQP